MQASILSSVDRLEHTGRGLQKRLLLAHLIQKLAPFAEVSGESPEIILCGALYAFGF